MASNNFSWDNMEKKKQDRATVSSTEPWEPRDLAKKMPGITVQDVEDAVDVVGRNRDDVEAWLKKNR